MLPTPEQCYRAVASRDQRFDGWIYVGVRTTRIYCRPSCPAVTPRPENTEFYPTAAAAQAHGFRACRRCRPDSVPGSPAWDVAGDVAGRAMRLIDDGVVERLGVSGLAARLGYTTRHLNRVLIAELGAPPLALARARRAHTARILLETTTVPITDVAFAAGFGSVRQFNATVRDVFAATPGDLRRAARRTRVRPAVDRGGLATARIEPAARVDAADGLIGLRLPFRPPYDAEAMRHYLAARAVPGLEEVVPALDGAGDGRASGDRSARWTYRRVVRLSHGIAVLSATSPDRPDAGFLRASVRLSDLRDLGQAVTRLRRLFGLDADPGGLAEALGDDPVVGPLIADRPGLRVPGSVDGFETAVRTIVGQQISISGARTITARMLRLSDQLDEPVGELTAAFPAADRLAEATELPMPAARTRAIAALAGEVAAGRLVLDGGADRRQVRADLLALPGVGPWTVEYIALRALADPDAFPAGDLGLKQALAEVRVGGRGGAGNAGTTPDPDRLTRLAENWRPLRSYAAQHLWTRLTAGDSANAPDHVRQARSPVTSRSTTEPPLLERTPS